MPGPGRRGESQVTQTAPGLHPCLGLPWGRSLGYVRGAEESQEPSGERPQLGFRPVVTVKKQWPQSSPTRVWLGLAPTLFGTLM